jgi:hypothetical protein
MRASLSWIFTLSALIVLTARCGGTSSTLGNAGDASVGGSSGGGSGGGSGSSSGSASSSGGSGSSSGSASSSGGSSGAGSSSGGGSGSGSGSGSSSGGGSDAGETCAVVCTLQQKCCGGKCVDSQDDPFNCGTCGNACTGDKSACVNGKCETPPCDNTKACTAGQTCCGESCCTQGQLCCVIEGGPAQLPRCITPTAQQPTCPAGCPLCADRGDLPPE